MGLGGSWVVLVNPGGALAEVDACLGPSCGRGGGAQRGPKTKSKTTQNRSQIVLENDRVLDRLKTVLGPSWVDLGLVLPGLGGRRMGFRLEETAFCENYRFITE